MKKIHFFLFNLIALLLLSACGGGGNRDPYGQVIPQKDIPPLHTGDKVIGVGEAGNVQLKP